MTFCSPDLWNRENKTLGNYRDERPHRRYSVNNNGITQVFVDVTAGIRCLCSTSDRSDSVHLMTFYMNLYACS